MEPVSRIVGGIVESAYYDISYRPSVDNNDLNTKCSSLLVYLSLADTTRNRVEIGNLKNAFSDTLNSCKSSEEVANFANFLEMAAQKGGYAAQFYNDNIGLINNYVSDNAKMMSSKQSVSKFDNNCLHSEYFNIPYRPKGNSDELNIECSSLLTYMALADVTRNDEEINNLMLQFYRTLLKCKDNADYNALTQFINEAANIGGYAIEFNNNVKGLINEQGKQKAEQYLKNYEKQKKDNPGDLEDFKTNLQKLNNSLEELKNGRIKDEEEVAYLLRMFNELQSDLYKLSKTFDKSFVSQCDDQIEQSITYLKTLYRQLNDVKDIVDSFDEDVPKR